MIPTKIIRATLVCSCFLGQQAMARAQSKSEEPLVQRVQRAIKSGIELLREKENGTGSWETREPGSGNYPGGYTSLAMLALLNAGVKPSDPIIERSLRYLRAREPEQTYVVALQTMVFAELGRNEDRERIARNVRWLIDKRIMSEDGKICRGWNYGRNSSNIPDNSNTQYALLGLHAGHEAGIAIDPSVWQSLRDMYTTFQLPDGSWPYQNQDQSDHRLTMTTAGLCGLLIAGMELNKGREVLRPDGSAANCGVYEANVQLARAIRWIGDSNHFKPYRSGNGWVTLPGENYYNLYGIERAGRLSGLRFFGDFDWYREGCEYLVERQAENGGWTDRERLIGGSEIVPTAFALLFLAKGRTPVLISKLAFGRTDDWNNDRNDARNLAAYASKNVFQRQPLGWQIFDTRRVDATTNDAILELAGQLLQSPIAYFDGHEAPDFSDVQQKMLREYVEQGGFILAEACCGRKNFDEGFRALMKKLFPDNPLRKLPASHAIWRSHAVVPPGSFNLEGIDYGCKTVVVYSPEDLSCSWENNDEKSERGRLAFRLGGNIIAYATGMEPPQPKLTEVEVVKDDPEGKIIPRGYLKVAQVRHSADWRPAPNAMRNLMDHLHKQIGMDVALQTKLIDPADPNLVYWKFLYMHGRGSFRISDAGIRNLRFLLTNGGLLFADACCGNQAFDGSFRQMVEHLFPKAKLEPIPLNDDLYSAQLNGQPITQVRCRTQPASEIGGGEYRLTPPYLEGIKVANHWAVIYSKYDIGCALEKHQSSDCLGHDHASALRLGRAAIMYALSH
jgi:hypothetical protein